MLGLLGKERLGQLGRQPDAAEGGPRTGCLWFAETGHNVCNQSGSLGFKAYWETHGLKISGLDRYAQSLQLFGLPLTEPKMETNSSGDRVLTQWFERARFEWHPGNPDDFKVLLGLLGSEVRENGGGGAPPPDTSPPATVDCRKNAPAPQQGAQAWVGTASIVGGAIQSVCGRLTVGDGHQGGVGVVVKVTAGGQSTTYPGITDASGIAQVQFTAPKTPGSVDISIKFNTGQSASTSFTVR